MRSSSQSTIFYMVVDSKLRLISNNELLGHSYLFDSMSWIFNPLIMCFTPLSFCDLTDMPPAIASVPGVAPAAVVADSHTAPAVAAAPVGLPPGMSAEQADSWFYKDPQGTLQGPFTAQEMAEWFSAGYFTMTLLVKQGKDTTFQVGVLFI